MPGRLFVVVRYIRLQPMVSFGQGCSTWNVQTAAPCSTPRSSWKARRRPTVCKAPTSPTPQRPAGRNSRRVQAAQDFKASPTHHDFQGRQARAQAITICAGQGGNEHHRTFEGERRQVQTGPSEVPPSPPQRGSGTLRPASRSARNRVHRTRPYHARFPGPALPKH